MSFINRLHQLIKYSDSLPRHLKTGLLWLIADVRNSISWRFFRDENRMEKIRAFAGDRKWVFILGCNNSGISLLHHLLSSHPDIATLPAEGHFLTSVLPVPMTLDVGRIWTEKIGCFDSRSMTAGWTNRNSSMTGPAMSRSGAGPSSWRNRPRIWSGPAGCRASSRSHGLSE